MKRIRIFFVWVIFLLLTFFLVSCGKESTSDSFTVQWSVNDTIVETDSDVKIGTNPDYNKDVPTKDNDDEYLYTFQGWAKNNIGEAVLESDLAEVTSNTIYYAIFSKEAIQNLVTYRITFKDADGLILRELIVEEGSKVSSVLPLDTNEWKYTNWNPAITNADEDMVYTAVRVKKTYLVTFKDASGAVIDSKLLAYGMMPIAPMLEDHQDNEEWQYSDSHWDKEIKLVTGAATYNEVINKTKKSYNVTFVYANGEHINSLELNYGEMPKQSLPNDTDLYEYIGWSPEVEKVKADAVYTAVRKVKVYKISNSVIVDNNDLKIVIKGISEGFFGGMYIDLLYENKTNNIELMFSLGDLVVNGYVISSSFFESLDAGKTGEDGIWISTSDLEQSGITTMDKIELYMRVYDNNDWTADAFVDQKFVVYPTGLIENQVISPNRPSSTNEKILVDTDKISVIIVDTYVDEIWGYTLLTYIENKTNDEEIMFSLEEAIVNGYYVSTFWAKILPSNSKKVVEITLSSLSMELSNITSVDKIDLYMRIYDSNNWFAEEYVDTKFTIYPTGLTESQIIYPNRPTNSNEYIVINNDQMTFIIVENFIDKIWGYSLKIYIENKSNTDLRFDWDDVLVNGNEIDPYFGKTVKANSRFISTISFYESDLKENNILEVTSIEFLLSVSDDNNWMADKIVESVKVYRP